jgi:hypothetical protein
MENYRHYRKWRDKVENWLRYQRVVQTTNSDTNWKATVISIFFEKNYSSRDSLYAIKSLKEDEDFSVIESETFGYFQITPKA